MKKKIIAILAFLKRQVVRLFDFIKIHENLSLLFVLAVFLIVPFLFLDNFYQFFTLILPMYVNEYGGMVAWLFFKKPIWQIAIACWSILNISVILWYLGIDLGRIIVSKIRHFLPKKVNFPRPQQNFNFFKKIKILFAKLQKKRSNFRQKIFEWLSRRGIIFLYFLCSIPFLSVIGTIILALVKIRGIKSGIWIIMAIGIFRTFLTVWAIQQGFGCLADIFQNLIKF